MDINVLIEAAAKNKASDIHLMEGAPPYFRIDGDLIPVKHPPLSHDDVNTVLTHVLPERLRSKLASARGVDLSYQHKDIVRCRLIIFYERQKLRIVFRLIPIKVYSISELELPAALLKITEYNKGMVLVTGPTGSGKTTTLAAIIDHLNSTEKISITTIEDPIEFCHQNKMGIVTQREVGDDVVDFNSGLVQSLRQDPDVILVGEMRDSETVRTAIKAAETGHYVLSTLHTTNAVQTIERIIGVFPQVEHDLIREQIAVNLKSAITQNLVRRTEGRGRVAAVEILIANSTVSKLISDNRLKDIYGIMQSGADGMQTFDQALAALVRENKITEAEGANYAMDIYAFKRFVKGIQSSSDRGGIISGFSS